LLFSFLKFANSLVALLQTTSFGFNGMTVLTIKIDTKTLCPSVIYKD
jgi:hypothetical protein